MNIEVNASCRAAPPFSAPPWAHFPKLSNFEQTASYIAGIMPLGSFLKMSIRLHVLIIEDSDLCAEAIVDALRGGGYDLVFERVESPAALTAALNRQRWDLIFSGATLRHFSGINALVQAKKTKRTSRSFSSRRRSKSRRR